MSFGYRGWHGGRRRNARGCNQQNRFRAAPPKQCICPICGMVVEKFSGQPCFMTPCPRCGSSMVGRFDTDVSGCNENE